MIDTAKEFWEKLKSLSVGWSDHLINALKTAASLFVARVFAAFGLTIVTYNSVLPEVKDFVASYSTGISGSTRELLGALGVDIAMTMILSAIVARVGMRAFVAGLAAIQGFISDAGG